MQKKGVLSNYFKKVVSHELFLLQIPHPISTLNCYPTGGLDKDTSDEWMEGLEPEGENWLKQKA